MRHIDKPQTDVDEQFVFFNSPAISVLPSGRTHHTELAFGWEATNPFTLQMSIALMGDSVVVNEDEFPHGVVCEKCLLPIANNTVACSVPDPEDPQICSILCIACGKNKVTILQEETWYISLDHVRAALADHTDYEPGNGDVRITRPTEDSILFRLGRHYAEHMYMNTPVDRLIMFVQEIDRYLGASDLAAMQHAYLDHGVEELERLANGG